ncbi:hypothetical protein [Streptomyces werraensis]|uniref:hypothetical protein n=1 Tax=Streptomyces werraensis TaxID=68284 RepID=UPI0037D5FA3E
MNGMNAERACTALLEGHRVWNGAWPQQRSIQAGDMHQVTPDVLRSLVPEGYADDWYVLPDKPITVTGDGTVDSPYVLTDPSVFDQ